MVPSADHVAVVYSSLGKLLEYNTKNQESICKGVCCTLYVGSLERCER